MPRPIDRNSAAQRIRSRVVREGDRYWTYRDFRDLPVTAVAAALSRLTRAGVLQRVRKGVYYRPRETVFGRSVPTGHAVLARTFRSPLHPAGLTAASVLGLTQQYPAVPEFATVSSTAPTSLPGALVRTRRPASRARLSQEEGALLELLRERASSSDLEPEETLRRILALLRRRGVFARVARAGLADPPRVRAMLGALGETIRADKSLLQQLRRSLNPLSQYDFGILRALRPAERWQAL